jgi:hypothetical protein
MQKKAYLTTQIVRMGAALNCFWKVKCCKLAIKCYNSILSLHPRLVHRCKEKKCCQWDCSIWCLQWFLRFALVDEYLHVACKRHANCRDLIRRIFEHFTRWFLILWWVLLIVTDRDGSGTLSVLFVLLGTFLTKFIRILVLGNLKNFHSNLVLDQRVNFCLVRGKHNTPDIEIDMKLVPRWYSLRYYTSLVGPLLPVLIPLLISLLIPRQVIP